VLWLQQFGISVHTLVSRECRLDVAVSDTQNRNYHNYVARVTYSTWKSVHTSSWRWDRHCESNWHPYFTKIVVHIDDSATSRPTFLVSASASWVFGLIRSRVFWPRSFQSYSLWTIFLLCTLSVYPVCHYFAILLSIVLMVASIDGHLPFLAACHCR